MFKKIICPIVFLICLMSVSINAETVWKDVGRGIRGSDFRVVAIDPGNADTVYISSTEAVYKTTDGGARWKVVFSAGSTGNIINSIAVDAEHIYIGTDRGLYRSKYGGTRWERIFSSIGNGERGVLFVTVDPKETDAIFIGTGSGLFFSKNGGQYWEKGRNLPSGVHYISVDNSDNRTVYAAADNGVYMSMDSGLEWARVYETNVPEEGDVVSNESEEIEESAEVRCLVIAPEDNRTVLAGTSKGLLITRDSGRTWQRAGNLGLASRDIRHIAFDHKGEVYTATGRGVFIYSMSTNSWDDAFKGLAASSVRYLSFSEGDIPIWAAADRGIFKTVMEQALISEREISAAEVFLEFTDEPTIEEIRLAAITYADVHPSKIEKWRTAAARKALLPDLRFAFDKNRDWQNSTYFYSTSSQKYTDDDITQGNDSGWSVSLTWDLGELIWNNDQTSIDSRSRYAVQLRDDLLNEVTRLYFERRRLQVAMVISPPVNVREKIEKEIRLQELTAGIDALTDSYLSKRLNKVLGWQ